MGYHSNEPAPVFAQFNMKAMHKSAKEFIDAYNRKLNQAKANGENPKTPSGEPLKPIHSNLRATVHAIITVYVRQLNASLMTTLAAEESLPGFKTTVGSLRGLKGCSERTIQNHKQRLQLAGVLVQENSLGKVGTELYFHHDIVFSLQAEQIQEYFTNHTAYPGLEFGEATATEPPEFSGNATGNVSGNFIAQKPPEQPEKAPFSAGPPNAEGENFAPFNAGTSGTDKIKDGLVEKSGVPSEQGHNLEQGIWNLGAAQQSRPQSQPPSPAGETFLEKNETGAGAAAARSVPQGGGTKLRNMFLGRAQNGEPEQTPAHPLRKDDKEAGSLGTLCAREVQFVTKYALSRLYPDTIFNDIEFDKIAALIQETAFWEFKTIGDDKQLERHSKMIRDRIDWAADWYRLHPHIIAPPAHLYFADERKYRISFARTYNWWVKNEQRRAMSEVRREVTLHRKGRGKFKNHTLTHLYRIHERRIAALGVPRVLEHFYANAELIYRNLTEQ